MKRGCRNRKFGGGGIVEEKSNDSLAALKATGRRCKRELGEKRGGRQKVFLLFNIESSGFILEGGWKRKMLGGRGNGVLQGKVGSSHHQKLLGSRTVEGNCERKKRLRRAFPYEEIAFCER